MKKLFIIVAFVVIAGAAFAIGAFLGSQGNGDDPLSSVLNSSLNAAIDSSGAKDKIESALYDNVDTIAKKTGLKKSQVKKKIENLDISNWKATNLPSDAKEKGTETINYNGSPTKVTTYDDPSIVTIDTNGVAVTFEVPESAQGSLDYLKYLQ